jgi:hypothetical protein
MFSTLAGHSLAGGKPHVICILQVVLPVSSSENLVAYLFAKISTGVATVDMPFKIWMSGFSS